MFVGFRLALVSIRGAWLSSSVPRKGSLPFFSTSMVDLTEVWALLRVCKKVVAQSEE